MIRDGNGLGINGGPIGVGLIVIFLVWAGFDFIVPTNPTTKI